MVTRGRQTRVMHRAHELYELIKEYPGMFNKFYTNKLDCTSGERATAMRYLMEDKMIRQEGHGRGAMYYPTETMAATIESDGRMKIPSGEKGCSYCRSPVDDFVIYPAEAGRDDANISSAVRQSLHMCSRCSDIHLPSPSESLRLQGDWQKAYSNWEKPSFVGKQVKLEFKQWVYGETKEGYHLFAIVRNEDSTQDVDSVIRFSFKGDTGSTKYARGYRFLHRMFGHPDSLVGRNIVVSREANVNRTASTEWFWSWTPWPRLPSHVRRQMLSDDDTVDSLSVDGNDELIADVSVPQHHIHSIESHGKYTLIRIDNEYASDKNKNQHKRIQFLEQLIEQFVAGDITMRELHNGAQVPKEE